MEYTQPLQGVVLPNTLELFFIFDSVPTEMEPVPVIVALFFVSNLSVTKIDPSIRAVALSFNLKSSPTCISAPLSTVKFAEFLSSTSFSTYKTALLSTITIALSLNFKFFTYTVSPALIRTSPLSSTSKSSSIFKEPIVKKPFDFTLILLPAVPINDP